MLGNRQLKSWSVLALVSCILLSHAALFGNTYANETEEERENRIIKQIKILGGEARGLGDPIFMISLERIDLKNVKLKELIPYPSLKRAYFKGSSINNEQVSELKGCKQLTELYLDSTDISDKSLKSLGEIQTLEYLSLSNCNLTDEGIIHLEKCKSLKMLNLIDTHVTENGIAKLQLKLPNVKRIEWTTVPSEKVRLALINLARHGASVAGQSNYYLTNAKRFYIQSRYSIHFSGSHGELSSENWKHSLEAIKWIKVISDANHTAILVNYAGKEFLKTLKQFKLLNYIDSLSVSGHGNDVNVDDDFIYWGDDEIAMITKVKSIRSFGLNGIPKITSASMKHISQINGLEELTLNEIPVEAISFKTLAECKKLSKLVLEVKSLKGQDFEEFVKCKTLKQVVIGGGCEVLDTKSLDALQKRRPDIEIKQD